MENTALINRKNTIYWVKVVLWLAIIAVIWCLPPSGALTKAGVHNLAAFAGLIIGMLFLDFAIPSLVSVILIAFSGIYSNMGEVLTAGFGGTSFTMLLSIFLIGGIMAFSGLAEQLAVKMLSSKIAAGKPWTLTFLILFVSWIISVFVNAIIPIIIVSAIAIDMFRSLGIEKGNKWAMMTLFGIGVVSIPAQAIMPFSPATALLNVFAMSVDPRLNIMTALPQHMLLATILSLAYLFVAYLIIRLTCRNSIEKIYAYKPEGKKPFTKDAKLGLYLLVFYIAIQFIPLFFPAGNPMHDILGFLEISGAGLLTCVVAMMIRKKDGSPFITIKQIADSGVEWNMLMMLMAVGACASPMISEVTGIVPWMTDLIMPLVQDMSPYWIFVIICVIGIVATNLTDNMPVFVVLMPIIYTVALASGLNALAMIVWELHTVLLGIMLPASCPHMAIIFGREDTGYVSRGALIKWGVIFMAIEVVFVMSLGWASYHWFPNVLA